uniref:PBPe domain-containing protein n=1 Tax=Mesocestoides corti TaxID=53468 RepID=A0A5K3EM48_MESCO
MLFGAAVNTENPRGMASRFMASIWALFALVFLASYTANLAAFMISKDDFYDLKGINDWRLQQPWNHKPPFRFASIPSGATEENIRINFPEMAAYMWAFNRSTVLEGLKSLKSEEIDAFIYDATILEYWTSRDDGCKLKTVGNLYAVTGYGIGFPKGSRWLPKVNSRILHYQKNGKFHRWKQFWLSGACKKVTVIGNTNKTLGVKNFISAFILLLCGMLLCGVMFLFEHAFYRYIWRRIRISNYHGCCVLAFTKSSETVHGDLNLTTGTPNEPLVRERECQNLACLQERCRNQQEILKLSRHLRFLIDEMRANNEMLFNHPRHSSSFRDDVDLPSSAKSAQQLYGNSPGTSAVIKIPRTSWSNDTHFSNSQNAISKLKKAKAPPPDLRDTYEARGESVAMCDESRQLRQNSCHHGSIDVRADLGDLIHPTSSQNISTILQQQVATIKNKTLERVEKESVI